jgi:hypothetical protein
VKPTKPNHNQTNGIKPNDNPKHKEDKIREEE